MSIYDEVGGAPTFERLVHAFYVGVASDPELRAVYPEEDLGPAAERDHEEARLDEQHHSERRLRDEKALANATPP